MTAILDSQFWILNLEYYFIKYVSTAVDMVGHKDVNVQKS